MRKFKVISRYEGIIEGDILNEFQLKEQALYYYNNSDVTEDIDFDNIENCIKFVKRVDEVIEI